MVSWMPACLVSWNALYRMSKRFRESMPLHFPVTSQMHAIFDMYILASIRGGVVVVGDGGSVW